MSENIKGRDLVAPEKTVSVGGKEYRLAFNMSALRYAEDVFEDVFKKDMDASRIILRMAHGRMDGTLALLYAFAKAGGELAMDYPEFEKTLDFESVSKLSAQVQSGIVEMMPKEDAQKKS